MVGEQCAEVICQHYNRTAAIQQVPVPVTFLANWAATAARHGLASQPTRYAAPCLSLQQNTAAHRSPYSLPLLPNCRSGRIDTPAAAPNELAALLPALAPLEAAGPDPDSLLLLTAAALVKAS